MVNTRPKRPPLNDIMINQTLRNRVERMINRWEHHLEDEVTYSLTGGPSTYDAHDVAENALRDFAGLAELIGRAPKPRTR